MWIGSLKNNEEKPFGIKWPCGAIKALGVFFSYDDKQLCTKNLMRDLTASKSKSAFGLLGDYPSTGKVL